MHAAQTPETPNNKRVNEYLPLYIYIYIYIYIYFKYNFFAAYFGSFGVLPITKSLAYFRSCKTVKPSISDNPMAFCLDRTIQSGSASVWTQCGWSSSLSSSHLPIYPFRIVFSIHLLFPFTHSVCFVCIVFLFFVFGFVFDRCEISNYAKRCWSSRRTDWTGMKKSQEKWRERTIEKNDFFSC